MALFEFKGQCWEDGSCSFLGRAVAIDGTGTSVTGEGKCIKQADVSSIACSVYYTDGATPDVAAATPSFAVATAIKDTLQTGPEWDEDETGYNARFDFAASIFNAPGNWLVELVINLTGGGVIEAVGYVNVPAIKRS